MPAPALSVDHLSKRFGDRIAFDDVSFEVGHGEVFGFLGPNGAGKTTTVRTLGTLISPTSGSAAVAGIALTPENGVQIRRRISIMPESPGLYLRLSVAEDLECFADLYEVHDSKDRIDRALRAVNLALFLAIVELFAQQAVASAVLQGPDLLAQVLFTPLIAAWSIWAGLAVSSRSSDIRVAQSLSALAALPALLVTNLISFNAIHTSLGLAIGFAAALLIVDGFGWRIASAMFDRERLMTGIRS